MRFCHQNLLAALLLWGSAGATVGAEPVDLELVLAVDVSGSVDEAEYDLQLKGIAGGFRDPAVRAALASGPHGRIAVNLLLWAEHQRPKEATGWFVLADAAAADRFAALVEGLPRTQSGATGLGEGIAAAIRSILGNELDGTRQVIDVSGDGRETPARDFVVLLPQARAMANASGVTINGLAILNEDPSLLGYYRNNVQFGPGSFVLAAADYGDFAEAMRRKLLREIEYRPKIAQSQGGSATR